MKKTLLLLTAISLTAACEKTELITPDLKLGREDIVRTLDLKLIDSSALQLCSDGVARVEVSGSVERYRTNKKGQVKNTDNSEKYTFSSVEGRQDFMLPCSSHSFSVSAQKRVPVFNQFGEPNGYSWVPYFSEPSTSVGFVDSSCNINIHSTFSSTELYKLKIHVVNSQNEGAGLDHIMSYPGKLYAETDINCDFFK